MLDDFFEFAADALLDISEWKSVRPQTKRILEAVGIVLGLTSIVLYLVLN